MYASILHAFTSLYSLATRVYRLYLASLGPELKELAKALAAEATLFTVLSYSDCCSSGLQSAHIAHLKAANVACHVYCIIAKHIEHQIIMYIYIYIHMNYIYIYESYYRNYNMETNMFLLLGYTMCCGQSFSAETASCTSSSAALKASCSLS